MKIIVEHWRQTYNRIHPHSALSYRPSAPETIVAQYASLTLRLVQLQEAGHQRVTDRIWIERIRGEVAAVVPFFVIGASACPLLFLALGHVA
jgi:hypothetical protein